MVTKGQRRLGRTIRKLEKSVEFSTKESRAKAAEIKHNSQAQKAQGYTEDSPVQNLGKIQHRDKVRARTE
jgi:hypothetical protein